MHMGRSTDWMASERGLEMKRSFASSRSAHARQAAAHVTRSPLTLVTCNNSSGAHPWLHAAFSGIVLQRPVRPKVKFAVLLRKEAWLVSSPVGLPAGLFSSTDGLLAFGIRRSFSRFASDFSLKEAATTDNLQPLSPRALRSP